jgi:hypothetical protein
MTPIGLCEIAEANAEKRGGVHSSGTPAFRKPVK